MEEIEEEEEKKIDGEAWRKRRWVGARMVVGRLCLNSRLAFHEFCFVEKKARGFEKLG